MRFVIEKRNEKSKKMQILIPLYSLLISAILSGIVFILSNANPINTYVAIF